MPAFRTLVPKQTLREDLLQRGFWGILTSGGAASTLNFFRRHVDGRGIGNDPFTSMAAAWPRIRDLDSFFELELPV